MSSLIRRNVIGLTLLGQMGVVAGEVRRLRGSSSDDGAAENSIAVGLVIVFALLLICVPLLCILLVLMRSHLVSEGSQRKTKVVRREAPLEPVTPVAIVPQQMLQPTAVTVGAMETEANMQGLWNAPGRRAVQQSNLSLCIVKAMGTPMDGAIHVAVRKNGEIVHNTRPVFTCDGCIWEEQVMVVDVDQPGNITFSVYSGNTEMGVATLRNDFSSSQVLPIMGHNGEVATLMVDVRRDSLSIDMMPGQALGQYQSAPQARRTKLSSNLQTGGFNTDIFI